MLLLLTRREQLVSVSSTATARTPRTRIQIPSVLPLNIGSSKTAASTVVNDLALTVSDGVYQLTGDVTNTGITDANGMVVSLGAPATPVEPYSSYAVGSLTSNDFSSFTLTFTSADLSAIPIQTTWKDDNGNTLSSVQTFDLRSLASALEAGTRSGVMEDPVLGATGATGVTAGSAGGYAGAPRGGGLLGFGGRRGGGLLCILPGHYRDDCCHRGNCALCEEEMDPCKIQETVIW